MFPVDRQLLIDRLLEVANLTDQLEDDAADALIRWAVAQVDRLIAGTANLEVIYVKMQGLMKAMRSINLLAGNPRNASSDALADLLSGYQEALGAARAASEADRAALLKAISSMQPAQAVEYIIRWLQNATGK
jgi:hypothetical protein